MRKMTQEFQYLTVLKQRLELTESEKRKYYQLQQGFEGEFKLDQMQAFLTTDTLSCIDDLVLGTNASCVQIDKLLVIDETAYVIDVKNYTGSYLFSNDEWMRNGLVLQENISEQLHNAMRAVRRIFHNERISLEVRGVLIFINPHAKIEIQGPVTDTILTYSEIVSWLLELSTKAQSQSNTKWQKALAKNTLPNFSCQRTLSVEKLNYLKHGICCRNCGSNFIEQTSYYIECQKCRHREPKETAYVRTICDCGVLFHQRNLTIDMIDKFFDKKASIRYLKFILTKHFKISKKAGRSTSYYNKGVIFDYWFEKQLIYFNNLEKRTTWKNKNFK